MYALSEVLFVLASVVVLAICAAVGYAALCDAAHGAEELYEAQLNASLEVVEHYPDAYVYSPLDGVVRP